MAVAKPIHEYQVKLPKYVTSSNFHLGIAEKPTAAKRIATVLDSKAKKVLIKVFRQQNGTQKRLPDTTAYFSKVDGDSILIIPAFGHLFTLVQDGIGWQYPVYDFKWVPNHLASKIKKIPTKFDLRIESAIESIRYLCNLTDNYIIMTDYDEEGEVIGGVVLSELTGKDGLQNATRMKFSSFAKKELEDSLDKAMKGMALDYGMYNRGLMRHYLDWLWGINLSRALMLSLKNTSGQYLTLSTGRVQGPTLSFVSSRQQEIDSFVPVPYFHINLSVKNRKTYKLEYNSGLVPELKKAKTIVKDTKTQEAKVVEIKSRRQNIKPPVPYNLSGLQNDAYRHYKISPSRALRAAENLYLEAAISYPRTSSQKFPPDINHQEVISSLTQSSQFSDFDKKLKKHNKTPNEGKKTDPAHPCIYPTGTLPTNLKGDDLKLYKLIVHRYFATFGEPSVMEYNRINFDINGHGFHISGKRTVKAGWKELAGKYGKSEDIELPKFSQNQLLQVIEVGYEERFSRSPPYFNQSSLLKKMESEEIGTKATRSEIIQSLYDRKYFKGDPIEITPVGEIVNQVLKSYSPQVISVELSRKLEKMGDLIEESINKQTNDFSLADALVQGVRFLHSMLNDLQDHEELVGRLISQELQSQRRAATELGTCMVCKVGKLKIIKSLTSGKRFVGCSEYFNNKQCDVTFPLPQEGRLEPLEKECPADGYPRIKVFSKKRPWNLCLNPDCPLREEFKKKQEQKKEQKKVKK